VSAVATHESFVLNRCTRPTMGGRSAYTIFGFTGYIVAVIIAVALALRLGLPLGERLVSMLVPPLAFLGTVAVARWRAGYERIVFYEALSACLVSTGLATWLLGGEVARTLDVVATGVGVFLVFGRLGCYRVACCHGRPARRGVRYGRAHVLLGFPAFWAGRPLVPVQLIEAGASLALAGTAAAVSTGNGDAAALFVIGYGLVRFSLELVRGDRDRRYAFGLSEAQRMAVLTSVAAASLHPRFWTFIPTAVLVAGAGLLVITRNTARRSLLRPPHLHELQTVQERLGVAMDAETSEGLRVTRHELPDGRAAFVWSRATGLPLSAAARLATMLDAHAEVVPGRSRDLVHVLTSPAARREAE